MKSSKCNENVEEKYKDDDVLTKVQIREKVSDRLPVATFADQNCENRLKYCRKPFVFILSTKRIVGSSPW